MSLFRPYNYKPRPDVLKDAPTKNGFFLFWEIFIRKIWRFITLNIYYFLVTLPMLIVCYFTINGYLAEFMTEELTDFFPGIGIIAMLVTSLPKFLYLPLVIISVLLYGPATMGLTYIFRNFSREEHAWMSDFVSRGLANWKQGLFFGLLDVVVYTLLAMNVSGLFTATTELAQVLLVVLRVLSLLGIVVYSFMRHYFYVLAVTVNLSIRGILKNSWLFVMLGLGRNILSMLITIAAFVVCFLTIPLLSLILVPLIFYSFTGFATVFTCYPVVKKYIIVPALEREQAEKAASQPDADVDAER